MDPLTALAATAPATGNAIARPDPFGAPLGRGARIDRYVIEDVLGAGGMGIVYRAVDPELGRPIALKLVRAHGEGSDPDSQGQARLLREAQAMAKIAHPNIVTVYDVGVARDQVFVAMELVDGVSMSAWLHERPRSWREVLHVMQQAGRGLEAAHAAGLVHRDFKPDNVLVGRDGRVRVADLGLARPAATSTAHDLPAATAGSDAATASLASRVDLTRTGAIMGTPLYMAPEQHLGQPVDARTDQYSFCVAFFEGLYGTFPFIGATYAELMCRVLDGKPADPPRDARVPRWLHRIVLRGLSIRPDARFPSMTALLDALDRGLSRKRRLLLTGGFVAACSLAAAALALNFAHSPPPAVVAAEPAAALIPTAEKRQATFVGNAELPRLSPDGLHLAYVTQRSQLFVQELATGNARLLSRWSDISDIRWSPDGATLLAGTYDGAFIIPRDGGERRYVGRGAPHVAWSSDGRTAAITLNTTQLLFVDIDSGAERELQTGLPSTFILDLDWSHEDDRLLLLTEEATGSALWTLRPDGSELRQVHRMTTSAVSVPRWVDRDTVTVLREVDDGAEIVAVRLRPDGPGEELGPILRAAGLGQYDFSSDRKRLAYTAIHRNQNIVRLTAPPEGAPATAPVAVERLTTGTQRKFYAKPSPDGTALAFVMSPGSRIGHIFVMPLAGGAPRQLTTRPQTIRELAWSPDGRALAYLVVVDGETQLWRLDIDSGDTARFPIDDLGFSLAWAPGDAILVQRADNRNFAVLDPKTGAHRPLVADDTVGWMFFPEVAPDRDRIALFWNRSATRDAGIWLLSLQDGAHALLAPGQLYPIGWSPDGASVYTAEFDQIVAFSVADGKKRTVLTFPAELAPSDLVVVPGTTSFVAIDLQDKYDIWLTGDLTPDAVAELALPPTVPQDLLPPGYPAALNPTPQNLDFEVGEPGAVPPGWHLSESTRRFTTAVLTRDRPHHGQAAVLLDGTAGQGRSILLQFFDGVPWQGKVVRLRAALRVDPAGDPATSIGLWLHIHRPRTASQFIQLDPPDRVTQDTWTVRELTAEIPPDVTLLALGVDLTGKGKAYADAIDLDVVPPP